MAIPVNILSQFTYPEALWAFPIILVVILLYLLRPKPRDIRIPSIMFIMDMERKSRLRSLFRRLIRDPLLLIQILIITFFIFALANPFFIAQAEKTVGEDVVLVIDASASMQAKDINGKSRFSRAVEISKDVVMGAEGYVSIVLAENVPVVMLKKGSRDDALGILNEIDCKSTPTDIGSAILLAKDMHRLGDEQGKNRTKKIYVLSDFSNSRSDPLMAQQIASNEGINVDFIEIASEDNDNDNIGIIDLRIISDYLFFNVKNFNKNRDKKAQAKVLLNNKRIYSTSTEIGPGSYKSFSVKMNADPYKESVVEVVVSSTDDVLGADDRAYAIIPKTKKQRILLIAEKGKNKYLEYALTSSQYNEVERVCPPVLPSFDKFDIIILGDLGESKTVLPGDIEALKSWVDDGGGLIIVASPALADFCNKEDNKEFKILMPINPLYLSKNDSKRVDVIYGHEMLRDVNLEEVTVWKHYHSTLNRGAASIAEVNNQPFIAYKDYGGGKVVFIGVNDNTQWSDFHLKPSFPILYMRLAKWLSRGDGGAEVCNFDAGSSLIGDNISALTPSKKRISATNVLLDEIGVYEIAGKENRIGVSLNNEIESDINTRNTMIDVAGNGIEVVHEGNFTGEKEKVDVKNDLYVIILVIVSLFIFLELTYLRRRGQI